MEQPKESWILQCVSCYSKICDDYVSCKTNRQGTLFVSSVSNTVQRTETEDGKSLVCACGEIIGDIMSTKIWKYRLKSQKINRSLINSEKQIEENSYPHKNTSSSDVQSSTNDKRDAELEKMSKRLEELEGQMEDMEMERSKKLKDLCHVLVGLKMEILRLQQMIWILNPDFAMVSNLTLSRGAPNFRAETANNLSHINSEKQIQENSNPHKYTSSSDVHSSTNDMRDAELEKMIKRLEELEGQMKDMEMERSKKLKDLCHVLVGLKMEILRLQEMIWTLNPDFAIVPYLTFSRSAANFRAETVHNMSHVNSEKQIQENSNPHKKTSSSDVHLLEEMRKRLEELKGQIKAVEMDHNEKLKDLCRLLVGLKMEILRLQEMIWTLNPEFAMVPDLTSRNAANFRVETARDSSDVESGYGTSTSRFRM